MTSCTKRIWKVTFLGLDKNEHKKLSTYQVAARDLLEVLSYYTQDGCSKIVEIQKLEEEVTYYY